MLTNQLQDQFCLYRLIIILLLLIPNIIPDPILAILLLPLRFSLLQVVAWVFDLEVQSFDTLGDGTTTEDGED